MNSWEEDKQALLAELAILKQSQTALMLALEVAAKGWRLQRAVAFPSERPEDQSPGEARWAADEWMRENGHLLNYEAPRDGETQIRIALTTISIETVHACPPEGSGIMPCCGKTPFEASRRDRMTVDENDVTCKRLLVRDPIAILRRITQAWLDKQGHDRCWYYPDLFREIAKTLGLKPSKLPALPSLPQFQEGCRRYQREEYRGSAVSDGTHDTKIGDLIGTNQPVYACDNALTTCTAGVLISRPGLCPACQGQAVSASVKSIANEGDESDGTDDK